jgi:hypothetical protein
VAKLAISRYKGDISSSEAAKYVGKNATVCGQVASGNYSARSRRAPSTVRIQITSSLLLYGERTVISFRLHPRAPTFFRLREKVSRGRM